MYEVTNKTKGPTQLVVKSFGGFTEDKVNISVLNIPGLNTYFIDDERVITEYADRSKDARLIDYKFITRKEFEKKYDPSNPKMRHIPGHKRSQQ